MRIICDSVKSISNQIEELRAQREQYVALLSQSRVESGLLKGCYDEKGALTQAVQSQVLGFLNTGTVQDYSQIASIRIFGKVTVHDLWCMKDHIKSRPKAAVINVDNQKCWVNAPGRKLLKVWIEEYARSKLTSYLINMSAIDDRVAQLHKKRKELTRQAVVPLYSSVYEDGATEGIFQQPF